MAQTNYCTGTYPEPDVKWPNNVFGGIMGSVGYTSGEHGEWRPFWSKSSNCCLSYVSSHDQLTLWDKLAEGLSADFSSVDDRMIRMNKLAGSVVLVSKGGVFMQAGEEFARTKNGDRSGSPSDSVNKIDWNRVNTYSDIQAYYRGMIRIRKAFSGFRSILTRSSDNWNPENNNIEWISKDAAGMTAFYETNHVPGEWDRIAVLINNAVSDETVHLTGLDEWVIVADGVQAGLEKISESGPDIVVPAKSVMAAVPKDTFDENHVSKNEPPVIVCDTSYRVLEGAHLTFTVETSDPDGDTVTLEAAGIPDGAFFDAALGIFRWEAPAAGVYTVTLSASDGKNAVTKTITITVTSEIKELIRQAEEKNYQKTDFTQEIYQAFESALANAKEAADNNAADDAAIQAALQRLEEAFQNMNKEAAAKAELADAFEKAKTRLAQAQKDPADYEAEAVSDLKTVISEAEEFIKSVHSAQEYLSRKEDLEYAVQACAQGGSSAPDKTALLAQITRAENVIKDNPNSKNLAALKKSYDEAKMVQINSDASQVDINQAVRALKKSIAAVLEEKPAEPGIKPSVPGWEPANPSVTPTQPGGEPEKPGADPQEPGGEPEKPSEEPAPEEQVEKLKITKLTISRAGGTAQAGDNISISVRSSGGTGVIKYRFLVKKNASSAIIKNDSIFRFAAWKPKEAGTYSIIVYAVDEEGRTAKKTISNYVINSRLQVKSFKVSPSSKKARAGEKVQLAVKASGGTKKYQYKYAYKKSGTKKINTIKNYSSKRTVNWRPKKSGKYTLYVYVRDKTTKRIVKKTVRNYIVGKN